MMGFKVELERKALAEQVGVSKQWWDLKFGNADGVRAGLASVSKQWWDLKWIGVKMATYHTLVLVNNDGI